MKPRTMRQQRQLKPCPFCGKRPTRFPDVSHFKPGRWALTHICPTLGGELTGAVNVYGITKADVIKKWNTRAECKGGADHE